MLTIETCDQAEFIGWGGNIRFYLHEGKLWSWPFGGQLREVDMRGRNIENFIQHIKSETRR